MHRNPRESVRLRGGDLIVPQVIAGTFTTLAEGYPDPSMGSRRVVTWPGSSKALVAGPGEDSIAIRPGHIVVYVQHDAPDGAAFDRESAAALLRAGFSVIHAPTIWRVDVDGVTAAVPVAPLRRRPSSCRPVSRRLHRRQ